MAKEIYNLDAGSCRWNPDGTRNGKIKVRAIRTVDAGAPDEIVAVDPDGIETTVTGTLEAAAAAALNTYLSLTDPNLLVEGDIEII